MQNKAYLLILALVLLIPFTSCSKSGDPATASDMTPDLGLEAPGFTPPRDPSDGPMTPDEFETAIELDPSGEPIEAVFELGGETVAGIEVRIDGELADITDETGAFEIPAIRSGNHTISFAILGHEFHSQPYSPVARFAQNSPEPGPGVSTGVVRDENGPVAGALVVVVKGESHAFAFSGQFGDYHLTGAPAGNCLAACVAEFHDPVFHAVQIPPDGTPAQRDFDLPLNLDLGRIIGRVVSPGIGPVPSAYVRYEAPGVVREDLSNIFGMFDLQAIPVGSGTFTCVRDGFYPVERPVEVNPGLNPVPVILILIEQSTVHGYVVDPTSEAINGALVRLTVYQGDDQWPAVWGQLSGPQGYFHFEDLLPGPYVLQAFMPGKIPATQLGTILPGSLIEEVLVLAEGIGGLARGWVVDWTGEPIIGAVVQLRYIGSDVNILALTGDNGYWELDYVPYGACIVRAESACFLPGTSWCDIYPNDPGETISMCFPVLDVPTGALGGTVTDNGGSALPYALVWVFNLTNPEKYSHMTLADQNGEYLFPSIAAGTTAGWALADGYIPDDGYVEVPVDGVATLPFELMPE